jgi:hypothetical protein
MRGTKNMPNIHCTDEESNRKAASPIIEDFSASNELNLAHEQKSYFSYYGWMGAWQSKTC